MTEPAFLVWLPKVRPSDWGDGLDSPAPIRALRPERHLTGQTWLGRHASPGAQLWLMRIAGLGPPAPALDGRIVVDRIEPTPSGLRFWAAEGSAWYGWNDARSLLLDLRFEGGGDRLDAARPFGQQLRTTRRLTPASAEAMARYAAGQAARPRLFISYRWRDSSAEIAAIAAAASAAGFSPWFDRWSGPRRLSDGLEAVLAPDVAQLLRTAIAASQAAVVIESPGYGGAGWTAFEADELTRRGVPLLRIGPSDDPEALRGRFDDLAAQVAGLSSACGAGSAGSEPPARP